MRQKVTSIRLQEFMRTFGTEASKSARIFLVGGATAVLCGWRESTIDIDLKIIPDRDDLFRAITILKDRLQINIKLASPDDFIPPLPSWEERSRFIQQEGKLTFLHYDFYAQALAKIERSHETDLLDVGEMINTGLVEPLRLRQLFNEIEKDLYRYPAIDPVAFRTAVERVISS